MKWVIVYGSLADGVQGAVGPFDSQEDAERYADSTNLGGFEKYPVDLEPPDPRFLGLSE